MKFVIPFVVLIILGAFFLGGSLFPQAPIGEPQPLKLLPPGEYSSAIDIPAVRESGVGVLTRVEVEIVPGTGQTFVNIKETLSLADFQNSINTARDVVQEITGIDFSDRDIQLTVKTEEAKIIEGPSGGWGITTIIYAAATQKQIDPNVIGSATIRPDHTLGPVGGIPEKVAAAEKAGYTTFIKAPGGGISSPGVSYEPVVSCRPIPSGEYCEVEYKQQSSSVEGKITVIEARNFEEAIPIIFEEDE